MLMDPMVTERFASLASQETNVTALMMANITDKEMTMMCIAELRGIRGERSALHMARCCHLRDSASGRAFVVALEAYYSSPRADPVLWEGVARAIGIFVDEAAVLSEQRIAQEKANTMAAEDRAQQEAEKAKQEKANTMAAAQEGAKRLSDMAAAELRAADMARAQISRANAEAAEADVRRRRAMYDTYNCLWRAFHSIDDVT
jgi:hypothetical protein